MEPIAYQLLLKRKTEAEKENNNNQVEHEMYQDKIKNYEQQEHQSDGGMGW